MEVGSSVTVGSGRKLVLDSGTCWFKGAQLGTSSGGSIEVTGGDHVLAWAMPLNPPPTGGASFRMTGGTLSLTNNNNSARCTLSAGSRMSLEGGTLSVRYQVDLSGTRSAPAVIDIYTNATLLQNPGIGFNVSRTTGGFGMVNIRGGSLILSNSSCNVPNVWQTAPIATTGLVNLVDGTFNVGTLSLGYSSNGVGFVQQSGGLMQVTSSTLVGKERDTLGVLTQEGGTSWHSQLYAGAYASAGSVGEVNLSGGTMAVAGSASALGKYAGSTGRLLQTGGELILSNSFSVGNAAGAFGVITNTGGRFWSNNTLNLGNSGAGAFGGAYFAGPTNYVKSAINVGNSATDTGELTLADGALTCDGGVTVGNAAGATGTVSVTGGTLLCKGLVVGNSGQGTLAISGGLVAVTNGGGFTVASAAGSTATVEISGGTNLFVGQGINFGLDGSAFVRITGGYTYTTNRVVIAQYATSAGRLELSGGVFAAPIIDGRVGSQYNPPGGASEVLFDGGTFQHSASGEYWMPGNIVNSFGKATLTDRGAVIDSNGDTVGLGQALSNEVGYAGSFTKIGAGKLTLSSWDNAFTGKVTVEEGELAVSGAIYLTGGVAVDPGAHLNLGSAGAVCDSTTASGTVSRIDGALTLKSGVVLTNGVGASLSGSGVVTGSVVFASGSVYGRDKANGSGALQVTGNTVIQDGVTVALTGYTLGDLTAGIPLVTEVASGTIQTSGRLPVTLDGASHPYWWAKTSSDGKTLTARVIYLGTLISVK